MAYHSSMHAGELRLRMAWVGVGGGVWLAQVLARVRLNHF